MSKVSAKTPLLPPERKIEVPTNWKASARHDEEAAGVNSSAFAAPIVPVSPVTVTMKVPPTVGVDGLTTTEVTLLELALMVSCTDANEKFRLVSKLPEVGGPLKTLTV